MASVALASVLTAPAVGQEVGVFGSVTHSNLNELAATRGYGAYVRTAAHSRLSVRLGYERAMSTSTRLGLVCTLYAPAYACDQEKVKTDTRIRRVAVFGGWRVFRFAAFDLEAGGGLSLNALRVTEETASGRWSGISVHLGENVGMHVEVLGRLRPFASVPFIVEAGVEEQRLMLPGCSSDPLRYAPFCGTTSHRAYRLGIAYAFRS